VSHSKATKYFDIGNFFLSKKAIPQVFVKWVTYIIDMFINQII